MSFQFRPAIRENVGLLIGLAGPSGSGKTFSAMRLAKGLAGSKKFVVLDTEAGRAKHYADQFSFDHGDVQAPFSPMAYMEAIKAADDAGYPVIVVDSMSHEHAGEGGLLDWHESELERMAGQDWQKREACKMAAWIQPKMAHKQMVQRLLQVRAHLILCFRAEEKIKMERLDGKMKIIPQGWMPITEKNLPYELTVSFLLTPEKPGVGIPIKLQSQHRPFFDAAKPIDEQAGSKLAQWASGGVVSQPVSHRERPPDEPPVNGESMTDAEWTAAITKIDSNEEWARLKTEVKQQRDISDLRKVKPDKRVDFLVALIQHGKSRGVVITL
jgi:AAA domain-containing protein